MACRARRASSAGSHPLRRATRLRPAGRDLRRPRQRPRRWPSRWRWRARAAAALGERRGTTSLDVESFEPEFRFDASGDVIAARSVPQTEAHRLIERLMILANEQVAPVPGAQARARDLPGSRAARPAAGGTPGRPASRPRDPDSADAAGHLASRCGRDRRRGEPAGAPGGRAARPWQGGVYIPRASGSDAGAVQRSEQRPRRPRQRRLLPFHLADPTLPGPRRPPGAAREPGRGGGCPAAAEAREAATHASERERDAMRTERGADDICAAFLLERELSGADRDKELLRRGVGAGQVGRVRRLRGELGDVYEGFLPARRMRVADDFLELNETETALVGRDSGRRVRLWRPGFRSGHGGRSPAGRVDLDRVKS